MLIYFIHLSLSQGATNISCHIDWKSLASKSAEYLQQVFYHYHSKDARHLFHLKSILALRADAPTETPLYMYMGSANFSAGAWGRLCRSGARTLSQWA
jgi:hypothetical protein